MDVKEHISNYDPNIGHPDKKTNAPGFNYFFLGNGFIEVAIQYNTSLIGTPLGVIIMDPDKIGKKSDTITFDPKVGFERTMIDIKLKDKHFFPTYDNLFVDWHLQYFVPTVVANWGTENITILEIFYCPFSDKPILNRIVYVINNSNEKGLKGSIGIDLSPSKSKPNRKRFNFSLKAGASKEFLFTYTLYNNNVLVKFDTVSLPNNDAILYWNEINSINFNHSLFNKLFTTSKYQISATISKNAKMDASVWQYNREWLRDMSNVAMGSLFAGHSTIARKILQRLIDDFIDENGSSIDSSVSRPVSEVELDQNGILLYAIWQYWVWTNDFSIIKNNWEKIKAIADFPLQDCFWDKESRLLKNCREYWERHNAHGVTDGYELTYQIFPVLGLSKASEMAEELGESEISKKWKLASDEIWNAFLNSQKFAMIEDGKLIKRRKADGSWHKVFEPPNRELIPEGTPLREEYYNPVDPDTSAVLPIAFKMIDPKSKLAINTLKSMETLWNQRWYIGGYGRYNIKSEPDSPGPWPFATLFVTRAYVEARDDEKIYRNFSWLNEISNETCSWFEFYGWRPIPPCPPPGIIPWVWAEILICLVYNMLGLQPLKNSISITPKIPKFLNNLNASFNIGETKLLLNIKYSKKIKKSYAQLNNNKILFKNDSIEIPKINGKLQLNIYLKG